MQFKLPSNPEELATYLPDLMALIGAEKWFKRAEQLADEMDRSPYLHKIVLDYHWLEMNVCHQWQVLTRENRVDLSFLPHLSLAALNFAATEVEVHRQLGHKGRRVLAGRLLDALKAEIGFAALYLELLLAQRLSSCGLEVELPDMEGTGQFDIRISRGCFSAEIECKSQSVDAGRQIHRKQFYRFMVSLQPGVVLGQPGRRELVLVTLPARLNADLASHAKLADAVQTLIASDDTSTTESPDFHLQKHRFEDVDGVEQNACDPSQLKLALAKVYGPNLHGAGWEGEDNAYLLVMRSKKADDTSFPLLEAMRKGASQLSKTRPSILALQEHGIEPEDLFLPPVQLRALILAGALFGKYKARHVNAVYMTGYGSVVNAENRLRSPGFAVTNMLAKRRIPDEFAALLVSGLLQEVPFNPSEVA